MSSSANANNTTPDEDAIVNHKTMNNLLFSSMKVILETEKAVESIETGSAKQMSPLERSLSSKKKFKI